ncbi:MAG: hypothetical protein ACUVTL_04690 [Thermoproteota archaeon]
MAGLKHAWYIKSHDPEVKLYILYNDLRASGKKLRGVLQQA